MHRIHLHLSKTYNSNLQVLEAYIRVTFLRRKPGLGDSMDCFTSVDCGGALECVGGIFISEIEGRN